MLHILPFTHRNVIATRANDILGIKDYEKIHPFIHNIINAGQKVRWYFEMEDDKLVETASFWEDGIIEVKYVKMNFTHAGDIEKIAIVGPAKWEKWMRSVMQPFTTAEVRYFDLEQSNLAKEWIVNPLNQTTQENTSQSSNNTRNI